jgi:hypothetical protein
MVTGIHVPVRARKNEEVMKTNRNVEPAGTPNPASVGAPGVTLFFIPRSASRDPEPGTIFALFLHHFLHLSRNASLQINHLHGKLHHRNLECDDFLRRTPCFRPLGAENKMNFRGLLSIVFSFVCRSLCALKPFRKERTSRALHCPSSLSVF